MEIRQHFYRFVNQNLVKIKKRATTGRSIILKVFIKNSVYVKKYFIIKFVLCFHLSLLHFLNKSRSLAFHHVTYIYQYLSERVAFNNVKLFK